MRYGDKVSNGKSLASLLSMPSIFSGDDTSFIDRTRTGADERQRDYTITMLAPRMFVFDGYCG